MDYRYGKGRNRNDKDIESKQQMIVTELLLTAQEKLNDTSNHGIVQMSDLNIKDSKIESMFLDRIKSNDAVYYNAVKRTINKKLKYPILDIKSLLEYIRTCETGLIIDKDLIECYEGIEEDLEVVKNMKDIRILNKDKKTKVIF